MASCRIAAVVVVFAACAGAFACSATFRPSVPEEKSRTDKVQVVRVKIIPMRFLRSKDADDRTPQFEEALQRLPSVKLIPHTSATPFALVEYDPAKVDVGELANAISQLETPGTDRETPAAGLLLSAKLPKDRQGEIREALAGVKGVDAEKSEAGQDGILIVLREKSGAKLAEILEALKAAGVTVEAP